MGLSQPFTFWILVYDHATVLIVFIASPSVSSFPADCCHSSLDQVHRSFSTSLSFGEFAGPLFVSSLRSSVYACLAAIVDSSPPGRLRASSLKSKC